MRRSRRFQDWPERLADYLADSETKIFAWGCRDCALSALGAVQVQTGDDHGAPYRGHYDDAEGAQRALMEIGAGSLQDTVTSFMGPPLESVRRAQRGDLVLFESDEGPALGVVDLSGTRFAVQAPEGLARLKLERASLAWRV